MTFRDAIRIWEIKNPGKEYFDDIVIATNASLNKSTLLNYLIFEFADMEILDDDSWFFHERIKNFFEVHRWNIDELAKTLEYEYDPLTNNKWTKGRNLTDHRDTGHQKDNTLHSEYDESGSHSISDVNFVSAFNEEESPEQIGVDKNGHPIYKYNDTEHDRQLQSKSYTLSGTKADVGSESFEEGMDENIDENIVYSGNEKIPYQDYIDKQRRTVEFNIYKWIARHFSAELLIHLW